MNKYIDKDAFKKLLVNTKKNREFIIRQTMESNDKNISINYSNLRLYYLENNKDMFINNSSAKKKLRAEEMNYVLTLLENNIEIKIKLTNKLV